MTVKAGAQLVSDDENDGGISIKALVPGLFEQSIQMRR